MAQIFGQFQEPFTGTALPATWTPFTAGSATLTYSSIGAQCNFPAATTSSTDGDITTASQYNLTGSFVRLNVIGIPTTATSTDCTLSLLASGSSSNEVHWQWEAGQLFASKIVAGSQTNLTSFAYNATTHAWWQIREKGGTTYWETSSDGVNWTTQFAAANPITVTSMTINIGGTCFGVDNNNTPFIWRGLNYPLPGTTTSTSSTSISSTSTSISSTSTSSTSASTSISSTSSSTSISSTSTSISVTTISTSSTSTSISSTSTSSTSSSTSISSTSTSLSSTSMSSTSISSTSTSTSVSSTSSSFSSTSSSISSTSTSVSSTSTSSTSSSTSTSTTTLPPPYYNFNYQDYGENSTTTATFSISSPTTWICPLNVTSVTAQCWGAGGGGGGVNTANGLGAGGGGGAYASSIVTVVPGTAYTVTVGAGGAAGTSAGGNGGNGGASWFSTSGTVRGGGGTGGVGNLASATVQAGGAGGTGTGTIAFSGGTGGGTNASSIASGGGGGGGAGSNGAGFAGGVAGSSAAGAGGLGNGQGSNGGAGGQNSGGVSGSIPGGGGGGGGDVATGEVGGAGAPGLVTLTYTTPALISNNTNLPISYNAVNYSDIIAYDGDYFIQRGSGVLIQMYKDTHQNNTDAITFTWKGRTTVSTLVSPFIIQIYNISTAAWKTLAIINKQPADTDFTQTVTQSANLSNYYDTTNTVTFRSYQLVI